MKLETSMDRVYEIVTRPENFFYVTGLDSVDEYKPNPSWLYFKVGNGLVMYNPVDVNCLEMHTAISGDDLPKNPIQGLLKQWAYLAEKGFYRVYAFAQHHRACLMCRAAGMNLYDRKTNMYEKVIQNGQ